MIGKLRATFVALAIGFLTLGGFGQTAKADFLYMLSVGNTWVGSGTIAFDASSGNASIGVTAFSFNTSAGIGSPQDYGLADILTIDWSIDDSFNLSLLLTTSLVPFGTGHSAILLSNLPGTNADPCGVSGAVTVGSISCEAFAVGDDGAHFQGVLTARLVEVAEPATIALFGAGLLGLGLIARKKKTT
jgi:hypothetical protein